VLADGDSRGVAGTRAAQLKALGNSIVLPQATAFVEAAIEAFVDACSAAAEPNT
jgi:hypothetical protein